MNEKYIQNIESLTSYLSDSVIFDNETLKMYGQITKSVESATQNLTSVIFEASKTFNPIIQSAKVISEAMAPTIHNMNEIGKTIAPIIQYLDENKDKIDNFNNSLSSIIESYSKNDTTSTDEAIIIVEELVNDGKAIINKDWSIEIVDDQTKSKPKSKYTFSDILKIINIAITITFPAANIDIDNSTTNNEYHTHYHIHHTEQVNNEQIVVKRDTNLYAEPSKESDILTTLQLGETVNNVITEDSWTMIVILDGDLEIKYNGWVENNFINPVIE